MKDITDMKKSISTVIIIASFTQLAFNQNLTQTVRGTIVDADSKLPLAGATVIIPGTNPLIGTVTDVSGNYRFEEISLGRIVLKISYMGYETKTIPDIEVNSGKEVVLNLTMQESILKMEEIVVRAYKNKGEAHNEMSMLSARSISPEETKRYACSYDDPSHLLTNFAGVTCTPSGNNDIIVRGNAPKYVQWRLEGVEITNPSHQADQNSTVGGFSALNNKLLTSSDFYTGAFSAEYGDVLAGVYDVKLRPGNNEKFEATAGIGLMGTELTVEGPFKTGYAGSYLINYRYSTIGLLQKTGIVDVDGVTTSFQDATFKIVLPAKAMGTFSFFGLCGLDNLFVKNVEPAIWQKPGDRSMKPEISENFHQDNYLANFGMNHTLTINHNSYIKTSLTYSGTGIDEDVFESTIPVLDNETGEASADTSSSFLNYSSRLKTSACKGNINYNSKINAKNKIHAGVEYSIYSYKTDQSQLEDDGMARFTLLNFNGNVTTLKNFVSWKHTFNERFSIVSGIHNMNVLFNHRSTIEPRIGFNLKLDKTSSIYIGYGKHSNMERIHNYFTRVKQSDGTVTEPNKNLDLLKADHFVVGYEKYLTNNLRVKTELYFQHLYNLPVENCDTSYYATINESSDYRYVPLVNKGTGKNYGIEITLERFFDNHFYFLINGSLYNSKYKTLEGIERNTKFNNNYVFNFLYGREFEKLGKNQNKILTLNAKVFFCGGQRYIPLLRDENGNLAVDPANGKFWDYKKAYNKRMDALYSLNLSVSYKINRPKATHEIFFDLPNITNHQGKMSEYYDESKSGSIGYITQMQFLPNIMYRIYF